MRAPLKDLLTGRASAGHACALTWVPGEVLAAIGGTLRPPQALAQLASSLRVDGAFVEARSPWAPDASEALRDAGCSACWVVEGPLSRIAADLGWPDAIRMSAADPRAFHARLDRVMPDIETDIAIAEKSGADALVLADDLAGAEGWLVSPDDASAIIARCSALISSWGCERPVVFHSDGDVSSLAPTIADAGFSAVHFGASSEAVQSAGFESAWAHGLCPVGGISVSDRSHGRLGSLADLARRGPCVIADDGGISSRADVDWLTDAFATVVEVLGDASL